MNNLRNQRHLYQIDNKKKEAMYKKFLSIYLTQEEILKYIDELFNNKYWSNLQERRKEKREQYNSSDLGMSSGTLQILYCIIRKCRPSLIIETGIHFGVSTWVMLDALVINKKGKLISIDNWEHEDCGCFVPDQFKFKWKLIKGTTRDILPTLKETKVDIFCHDSDHSYENQKLEYQWAIEKVKNGGFIFSHDLGASNAWFEFVKKYNLEWYVLKSATNTYSVGVAINKNKLKNEIQPSHLNDFFY